MKKELIYLFLWLMPGMVTYSQVAINPDGALPHSSAMLDINATDRGLLIPRLTTAQRNALPSPAVGLLIYNSSTNLFNYYAAGSWQQISSTLVSSTTGTLSPGGGVSVSATADSPNNSAMLDVSNSSRGVLVPRTTPASISTPATGLIIFNTVTNTFNYYNGKGWLTISSTSTGQTPNWSSQSSIGYAIKTDGTSSDPSSLLDISATNKGLLIPRLTSSQRDLLLPVAGLTIYNITSNAIEFYNGSAWYRLNLNTACGEPLADFRDGKSYSTVLIGLQCWMAENLNYGNMIQGSISQTNNSTPEKYCFNNDPAQCNVYGGLYQWDEMMNYSSQQGAQGLCPAGWHLPTDVEYCQLATFEDATVDCGSTAWFGTDAGSKLKEAGTTHWYSPNAGATNQSGFTGLPGGYSENNYYDFLGYVGHWWTSSTVDANHPLWMLASDRPTVGRWIHPSYYGFSVRCVKDCNSQPTQSNAGPDQLNIIGTAATLQGNTPALGTGSWSIISGTGGNIASPSNPTSIFTGLSGNSYTLRWTISTSCISSSDNVVISFWNCGSPIIDSRDNKTYNTVMIGTQCWMSQNLNYGTRVNGTVEQSNNGTPEKYCYANLESNCDIYGGMYQWGEAVQYLNGASNTTSWNPVPVGNIQGLCPSGWHLPLHSEYQQLFTSLGGVSIAGGKMKETGTSHWQAPNTGATNLSGFTAMPGGERVVNGSYVDLNKYGYFKTATEYSATEVWGEILTYDGQSVIFGSGYNYKFFGDRIRCVSDIGTTNQPPLQPSNLSPAHNSTGQNINPTISWFCSDPENDPMTYDVYFSSNNPPTLVSTGQASTTYVPATLLNNYDYFWKIVAHDNHGNSTVGPIWRFTTIGLPPSIPSNPSPANGSLNQPLNPTLSWTCTDPENGQLMYDLYFSNTNPPTLLISNLMGNTWAPGQLSEGVTYYWKVVVHDNENYTIPGPVWSFTTHTWTCGDVFNDQRNNHSYNTVMINNRCWMKENLNIGTRIDGNLEQTNNGNIEKYCYNNLESNCDVYGGIYQWAETVQYINGATNTTSWNPWPPVGTRQGICPNGWIVPDYWAYEDLVTMLGDSAGAKMKETGTAHWLSPNIATNESGFTALGAGERMPTGTYGWFALEMELSHFWTSDQLTTYPDEWAFAYNLSNNVAYIFDHWWTKNLGCSVRCIK
jgi:uncharacterized protein (TIGR02145 family)